MTAGEKQEIGLFLSSSLLGGTTKQSIMLAILAIKIASSAEKAFSQ
ncbi:hypothetical protein BCL90_2200 [Pedobacter alluvionis]|uniref:Uncharacterized protein n=1 Tax=Pedobacter alluvionis TaxID=475253 RepID=A0A497Y4P5_9SPHI|nr:hypothetical protein BCL90_2200 [Pedobacter alluvionis]